jgi:hypothetical protein
MPVKLYTNEVLDEMTHTTHPLTEAQKNHKYDRKRIRGRRAALLDLLSDCDWHRNYECAKVGGLSFNSHLYQLRKAGWDIRSRHVEGGVWEQRLFGKTDPSDQKPKLSGPQERVLREFALAIHKVYGDNGLKEIREHLPPMIAERAQPA